MRTGGLGPGPPVLERAPDVRTVHVTGVQWTGPGYRPGIVRILFIQGGGAGTHDTWDAGLTESLRRELGTGHEVRYPRMPGEDDPAYGPWSAVIRRELAALGAGAVLVGHSVGGTILINALADARPPRDPAAVVLVAAPFVGDGGWPAQGFTPVADLGARLPPDVPVHVFHGLADEAVPPSHAVRYGHAIPHARVHLLPGRDHQLGGDLAEVARVITGLRS